MPSKPSEVMTSLLATADDVALLRSVSRASLEAGRRYVSEGRVTDLRMLEGGRIIEAQTRGSATTPYRQHIALLPGQGGRAFIVGNCTCPRGGGCKHIAAVLLAARGNKATPTKPAPTPVPAAPALPFAIQDWLAGLEDAGQENAEHYPATVRQRLLYVLGAESAPSGASALRIACFSATLRKDGTLGAARPYAPHQVETPAKYLRPSDRWILQRLHIVRHRLADPRAEDDLPDLLRRILATGRAYWGAIGTVQAAEGPPVAGRFAWRLRNDGAQDASLDLPEGLVSLRLPAPWYAEPASGRLGPVEAGMPPTLAARILAAPPIPAEAAPLVAIELARRLPGLAVPPPAELDPPSALSGPPTPRLLLTTTELPAHLFTGHRGWQRPDRSETLPIPVARPGFAYGPLIVPPRPHEQPRIVAQNGRLWRLQRDPAAERAALQRLAEAGFVPLAERVSHWGWRLPGDDLVVEDGPDGTDWISISIDELPALRAEGWHVEIADDFPIRIVHPEGDIDARLQESSGIDWLELELGVVVDGERMDLVPTLLGLIRSGEGPSLVEHHEDDESFLIRLPDGRLLALPMARIRPIVLALAEIFAGGGTDPDAQRIGFTRLDAADLAVLEERSGLVWSGGEALRALGRQLREAGGAIPPVVLPPSFRGDLRPYQAEGVAWLQFLAGAGLGGVLADDMGLGKTVQTLAHLCIEHAAGRLDRPALIVCPTSLVPNWISEAARFAPGLRVLSLHGPTRKGRFAEIAAHDLVLTTYPLLARDSDTLVAQDWHAVILDEAQVIRNPNAETTRQARLLRARHRLGLSGTPLQNHLGELWSIFDFLAPGFLGSQAGFRSRYRTPIEKHGDPARQAALQRRVRPFLLRRTKAEVVRDLPPKTEITEQVELEAGQRAIYEGIRLAMHAKVRQAIAAKGLARSGIIILDALLKLRQACCDPRLLKLAAARQGKAGSAKLDRLMDLLTVLQTEGRRVVVFSQFTSMLALISERLRAEGIVHAELTGSTRDREGPVRRFQAGEFPVFLVSLKAGGVGLNLTAADTIIHYDPWWNPAAEDQATDRAHRIGQKRPVFVHRLVALATIEEKMEVLKARKRALVAAVLGAEAGGALRLTEAEVEELFAAG